jgi:hypothetical protein
MRRRVLMRAAAAGFPGCLQVCSTLRELPPDRLQQAGHAFTSCRRDRKEREVPALDVRAKLREPLGLVERVDLVGDDEHRLVLELFAGGVASWKERQLLHDDVEVLDWLTAACDETSTR